MGRPYRLELLDSSMKISSTKAEVTTADNDSTKTTIIFRQKSVTKISMDRNPMAGGGTVAGGNIQGELMDHGPGIVVFHVLLQKIQTTKLNLTE